MIIVGKLQIEDIPSPVFLEAKCNPIVKVQYKYILILNTT